ncbi:MAG: hypothetical protein H6841_08800 [Planctomycetes bacterium]|nr:hypothetical protein [Planctomycetota bacterium]MCB9936147.1 hypothetical protein [Planctomycetota bacterium]
MPDTGKQDTQRDRKPVPDQVTLRGDAKALKEVAEALAGKPLHAGVRGYVIPADADAYTEAIDNGAIAALHQSGFTICDPATPKPALAQGEFELAIPGANLTEVVEAIRG